MFCRNALLKINKILLRENQIQKLIPLYQYALYSNTEQSIPTADAVKAPRKIKIYTKTGDKGKTSLYTGERRPKNEITFEALGNGDELNSSIGLAREYCCDNKAPEFRDLECKLIKIQTVILIAGSHIATPLSSANEKQLARLGSFDSNLTKELENWIDKYDDELPVLKNFILPSGILFDFYVLFILIFDASFW